MIENGENSTIVYGREFGLPCNFRCGPGLRPYGTIHFENRKNSKDGYDESDELCVTISRRPKVLGEVEKCVFTNDEIIRILKFVSNNRTAIKDYHCGYTTSKGFLHALRKAKNTPKSSINWKRLVFVRDDIPLYVDYWAKDFTITYKSKFGPLKYGLHLMYMMPKIYTEEEIICRCKSQWPYFLKAEKFIEDNKVLLDTEFQKLMESDERFSSCWEWVKENVEENIQQIIRGYLEDRCKESCRE